MTQPGQPPDAAELAGLAVELARGAGALMLQRREAGFAVTTKSSATDVVTDADRAVERFLVEQLQMHRPGDAIRGEEGADEPASGGDVNDPSGHRVRWVIDPIDGTVNFMLGLPQYSVSIAAEVDGTVVAGCVHNPATGVLFHAVAGGGAWRDGERLTGPRAVPVSEAVVATGFGYDAAQRGRQGVVLANVLPRVGNVRRLGSAALDLCFVAAGWVDAYYEATLNEWDFAAGALIAAEAGAFVGGLRGEPAGPAIVVATHPDTAAEFVALLEHAGA